MMPDIQRLFAASQNRIQKLRFLVVLSLQYGPEYQCQSQRRQANARKKAEGLFFLS